MKSNLVISCHSDTGFRNHSLQIDNNGDYYGHLDNFIGVHAVMNAYFSGKLVYSNIRIELTYGEETDMEGAYEVLETLNPDDTVIVVDVTGAKTESDITIEKCSEPGLKQFVINALQGLSFDLYEGCPDPVAQEDECDVYKERLRKVCFLGIPCTGGDYNAGMVSAKPGSLDTAVKALIRLAQNFNDSVAQN